MATMTTNEKTALYILLGDLLDELTATGKRQDVADAVNMVIDYLWGIR